MNTSDVSHEVIVSGIHLELTPSLKTYVREKAERLFRHDEHIIRARFELECDSNQAASTKFTAKGHLQIHGPDLNATVTSDELHKALSLLVDKLDRMIHRRQKLRKVKRNHPHAVEIPAELPKCLAT